jgi:hypothetical protein
VTLQILGKSENETLEFKGRDALKEPLKIGRGVVAFLNAKGGDVWVGIREEEGKAVVVEGIDEPETARRMLRDHLVDTIEPSPGDEEVTIEVQPAGNKGVLRVRANPREGRKPYCQRKNEGRFFFVRIADRVRTLTREELNEMFARTAGRNRDRELASQAEVRRERERLLQKEREQLLLRQEGLIWVRVLPVSKIDLATLSFAGIKPLFSDPRLTGNRLSGWNCIDTHAPLKPGKGRIVVAERGGRRTEIEEDGGVAFTAPISALYWKGPERQIWPYILLELPISVFRLASTLYAKARPSEATEILGDMALTQVRGWSLRPYSVRSSGYVLSTEGRTYEEEADLIWDEPVVCSLDEVRDEPDRCGFRLVRRVYQAFGYDEEKVPSEFDRESGRLVLPE